MKTIHALLVDDDKSALETMSTILEMDNYMVSTAGSGQQALERLEAAEENPPRIDFMVVDLDMANLSGIELLLELRMRGHTLPVMVVTGFASKNTVVELLRQGVVDFLDKPVRVDEFRNRVHQIAKSVFKRRKYEAELPVRAMDPADHADIPFHAASIIDLSHLGIPYAFRQSIVPASESNLILACRKPHGYDLLLADVGGCGAEGFYLSVLIKSFFDKYRKESIDSREFLRLLNKSIMEGALEKPCVNALFMRVFRDERRLEILPAGYQSQWFMKLGESNPRMLFFSGAPLGASEIPEQVLCESNFTTGDRLFIYANGTEAGKCGNDDAARAIAAKPPRIRESIADQGANSVDEVVDRIWRDILVESRQDTAPGQFFLGMEFR